MKLPGPPRRHSTKIGRNDKCHCGSGKKFKKCHGSPEAAKAQARIDSPEFGQALLQKRLELEAQEARRQRQQGLSKPIISTDFKGMKVVAVGNKVYFSEKCKTFHDFLINYLTTALGQKIGNEDLKRPKEDQHPVTQWYLELCKLHRKEAKGKGKGKDEIVESRMTGAVSAYLWLAYSLYQMDHNQKLQEEMIRRLLIKDSFLGACYEARVLAQFLLAGFEVDLEDESDGSTSHVEFVATHKDSGRKFSVEAKSRDPGKDHFNIRNQLAKALKKVAHHERVIFVDLNIDEIPTTLEASQWPKEVHACIQRCEQNLQIKGEPAEAAYVIVTNVPHLYHLDKEAVGSAAFADGFKIPDFGVGEPFPSLIDAFHAKQKHREIFDLMESMKLHSRIPSTFDGESEALRYSGEERRLKIGEVYNLPTSEDTEIEAKLIDAVVDEENGIAHGMFNTSDGNVVSTGIKLTEAELAAYKEHPETFFGVVKQVGKKIDDPLEMFEFFYNSYKKNDKENLLRLMEKHPDIEDLKDRHREELLEIYAERMTITVMNMDRKANNKDKAN